MTEINSDKTIFANDDTFFATAEAWDLHRMSARAPTFTRAPSSEPVSAQDLGLDLVRVSRPDSWRFAAPPSARRDPRHPDFSRFHPESLVLTSESAVDAALNHARDVYDYMAPRADSALRMSELGSQGKFTIQRGVYGAWYVQRLSGGSLATTLPLVVQKIVEMIATTYRMYSGGRRSPSRPDPADTNGGWPTFVPHPMAKIAGAIIREPSFSETRDNAVSLATDLGIPIQSCLANGLGGRSGPAYKELPVHRFTGAGWEEVGSWQGYSQRNRIIHMSSSAVNHGLKRLFTLWHECRRYIPGLWHSGDLDFVAMKGWKYTYESDISGFDVSVTRELQTLIAWHFGQLFPEMLADLDFWLHSETVPMVAPAWDRSFSACTIMSFFGGTRSGLKTTAEAGILYSLAAALFALFKQGVDIWKWPNIPGVALLIQGDDVLIGTNRELNTEGWSDEYARLGLRSELVVGDMFLSRHHDTEHVPFPSAGRIVQQTLSNEHEQKGDPEITNGILALGFIARTENCEHLPPDLRHHAGQLCEHATWMHGYCNGSDFQDLSLLRTRLSTSSAVAADIATALEAAKNLPWLIKEIRDREHSPAAEMLARYVETHRPELLRNPTSLDQAVEDIIADLSTRPRSERLRLSAVYSRTVMSDLEASNLELATLFIASGHDATVIPKAA